MDSCHDCLMCAAGYCFDPDSDYYRGPVPDAACSLYERMEQTDFLE